MLKFNKRHSVGFAIIMVLLLGGSWSFFKYRAMLAKQDQLKFNNKVIESISLEDKKIADTSAPFIIDVIYPSIVGVGLDDMNKKIETVINEQISDFKKGSLANDQAVKDADPETYAKYPREYDLKISYTKGRVDTDIVSFLLNVYRFEGGAHGSSYFIPFNYDVKKQKEISLANVFFGKQDYLQQISSYAMKDLTAQITKGAGSTQGTWISDGASPKEENFSVFLLTKNAIIFYFSQYQVAPYSYGDYQVVMPLDT